LRWVLLPFPLSFFFSHVVGHEPLTGGSKDEPKRGESNLYDVVAYIYVEAWEKGEGSLPSSYMHRPVQQISLKSND
jgi:hypothetical protein